MHKGWLLKKSIVIIGGTSGIGLSAAKAFLAEGGNIVCVGYNTETTVEAKRILGDQGIFLTADAEHPETAKNAIDLCQKNFGTFDGLYHVAGGSGRKFGDGPLHEISLEGWNKTFALNLTSLMLSNQAAVKIFMSQKRSGTILNMTSVLASSPSARYFVTHAYAASKAAIAGFTRSIAAYYAEFNIRVNAIAPGLVETPMAQRAANDKLILDFIKTKQPLDNGRIGRPNDLAGAAVYFMSDHSAFTTGQILGIDGGWSVSEGQF